MQVFVHCEATGLACIPSSSITTSHLQRRGDAEVSFPIGPGEPPMMYVEARALQGSASIRTAAIIEMPIGMPICAWMRGGIFVSSEAKTSTSGTDLCCSSSQGLGHDERFAFYCACAL